MITEETTIGSIVSNDYRTAQVLSKYNIDFCCGGGKTLQSACLENNANFAQVTSELESIKSIEKIAMIDFQSWPMDLLVDYIEKKYHRITLAQMSEITKFLNKLSRVHGNNHPELIEVESEFNTSVVSLTSHMKQEEEILFPIIRKYYLNKELIEEDANIIKAELNLLQKDHEAEGDRFKRISQLTENYSVPDDGCKTCEISMKSLQDFETLLHEHVHIENNILFNTLLNISH